MAFESTWGTVERIGARSTRILGAENAQIIVPNSTLLDRSLVNYTLSNDLVRTQVRVGVAYGSPVREVARLLRQAIDAHPGVSTEREPCVLFSDFGDNALVFDALFWLRARTMLERRQVESDIRFQVDELFRGARVVVAFPQRDVHLDTASPLAVRLIREET